MQIILILALIIRVITDLCFKLAVNNVEFKSFNNIITPALTVLKHPAIVIAVMFCGLNFWLWCIVLSQYDLSFAYPLFGLCFAAIMICGQLFFNETLDKYKIIGILCIIFSSAVLVFG